jgi:plastocyanin
LKGLGEGPTLPRVLLQTLRRAALICGLLTLLPAAPALAANASVTVNDKAFSPADVAISPGESVTWSWGEAGHNVRVTDGPSTFDSGFKPAGATYAKAFTTAGTYRYVCDAHPTDMRGTVTVGGATSAAASPAPGAATPPASPALRLSGVSVSRLGVVRLRASVAGLLRVLLRRGTRIVRRWTVPLAAGPNRVPLALRRVRLGRYRLELHALGAGGRVVHRVTRRLVVTPAARARTTTPARPVPSPAPAPPAPAPGPANDAPDDSDGRVRDDDPGGDDDR